MNRATVIVSEEERAVIKMGDSLAIALPAAWTRDNGIKPGKRRVRVVRFGELLIIRPTSEAEQADPVTN